MIDIQGVSKSFMKRDRGKSPTRLEVLRDINLTIEESEFVTILGPSGCGKTTLLRMIAGLNELDQGQILVHGQPITGPSPERAMVFQSFALMPWADVMRNVTFGLELQGMPRSEREAIGAELIALVGLQGFEHSLPGELSGGMRQRVGLARALAVNPQVLLMDEPFGALDEQTKRLMQDQLIRIWEEHRKTVVFVTHSIDEAIFLADRVIVMSRNPGEIAINEVVPLARPRDRADESSATFLEMKARLWNTLKELQGVPAISGV